MKIITVHAINELIISAFSMKQRISIGFLSGFGLWSVLSGRLYLSGITNSNTNFEIKFPSFLADKCKLMDICSHEIKHLLPSLVQQTTFVEN